MNSAIGQSLGRYKILEQIGRGGMAVVYKALDTQLQRPVAIKLILPHSQQPENFFKRFEREAYTLARLSHPNILKIFEYGKNGNQPYLVMEYLPGGTLKERLGRQIPWREAAKFLVPIAKALDYAHQEKVIHRDIKPSNILLTQNGQPMLSDFGIAKIILDNEETADLTGTGVGIGTPEYMSPEQSQGKDVDARTDVYALGVVFYEMVAGRKPYTANTPASVLLKQVTEPLPRPSIFVPNLPAAVERTLIKALAKEPEDRYQSMGEFERALESLSAGNLLGEKDIEKTYDEFDAHRTREENYAGASQGRSHPRAQTPSKSRPRTQWTPWVVGGVFGLCVAAAAVSVFMLALNNMAGISAAPLPMTDTPFVYPAPAATSTMFSTDIPIASTSTDIPTSTAAPPATHTNIPPTSTSDARCPRAKYPTRIQAGREAYVCTASERLIVRGKPGDINPEYIRLYPGTKFMVVTGPKCVDDFWWWKIEIYQGTLAFNPVFGEDKYAIENALGWVREGWDDIDPYFICQD